MTVAFDISGARVLTLDEREIISRARGIALMSHPFLHAIGFRFVYRAADGMAEAGIAAGIITHRGVIVIDPVKFAEWGPAYGGAYLTHLWLHWLFNHYDRSWDKAHMHYNGQLYTDVWNLAADCQCVKSLEGLIVPLNPVTLRPEIPTYDEIGVPEDSREYVEKAFDHLMDRIAREKMGAAPEDLPEDFSFEDFMSAIDSNKDADSDPNSEQFGKRTGSSGNTVGQETMEDIFNAFSWCGSGAGGEAAEGEQGLHENVGEDGDRAIDPEWEDAALRAQVAESIKEYTEKHRGNGHGDLIRFAEDTLRPAQVSWQRRLKVKIMQPLLAKMGRTDYTYRRPHRSQMGRPGEIIRPTMVGSDPGRVAIGVDTSGSMSPGDLSAALSEIRGILHDFKVVGYAVDAEVTPVGDVFNVKNFTLHGGGGTDMRVLIQYVADERPKRTTALVVLTDGYTPWPETRPANRRDLQVIAGIITDLPTTDSLFQDVPSWIETVRIPTKNK